MAAVFASTLPPNQRLVLLAYADHADHDGGNIYPSVGMVAAKTGYTRRSVQLITRQLLASGWLAEDGTGPSGTNRYRITEPDVSRETSRGGGEIFSPLHSAQGGAKSEALGGRNLSGGGVKPVSPEPSVEPTTEPPIEPPGVDTAPARATPSSTPREMRQERDAHLVTLEVLAPGFGEAWAGWRVALPRQKAWTLWSEVLKLRKFADLAERYSSVDLLEMAKLGAERQWQGFEERWFLQERRVAPPLRDSRRSFRRSLPPGADDERRRQAAEIEAELRRAP